jgi:hypothetical protein
MAQPSVVVAFTSRCGTTEMLAHAAAVGVVNGRALPRLRRLADDGRPAASDCMATLERLRKEYVPPTEADIAGSPALIIVPSTGMTTSSDIWQRFIAMLDRIASTGGFAGKLGAVIDTGDHHAVTAFSSVLIARGLTLVAADGGDARAHGRAVAVSLRDRTALDR